MTDEKISRETSFPRGQYAVHETTMLSTTKSAAAGERKFTSPIVMKNLLRNASGVFRPSVHLGEIEQPSNAIRMNPFNSVHQLRFENNVQLNSRREHFQDVLQDMYQGVSSAVVDEATRPSKIKFQDNDDQQVITDYPGLSFNAKHVLVDPTFFQNAEKPMQQDTSAIFGKTMAGTSHLDTSRSPYVIGDQNVYQPAPQETTYEIIKQPENGILFLQQEESTYTRKRKFPYQFYQPSSEYHEVKYAEVPQHSIEAYPHMRKLSAWKKIVRLIGTFLPLGLLLATLTPNVVRINDTTQPNIVLSKLRAADLPVEHKRTGRLLDDQSTTCENRTICELILAGSEPESNILQNILWNLATRISNDVATKNGLDEVFDAVKKKDCTTITC
ncbi:PREDICTED: uncharacterized protein LOC106751633 [Dinoponera quadriceps]|uniref:Uncharacterized protein LOC106751633 n=1 Tax=Dinoponera quadriceps TaxID=609295 RepID=A0A6P3YE17_DINQU|nr:PREDICTED: uncharacterized protein LOC106751633 [Dinoponera quadriceps]